VRPATALGVGEARPATIDTTNSVLAVSPQPACSSGT
jgi:hypothetical protein